MKKERKIIFHGKYFIEFYITLKQKVQEKIEFVFKIIKTVDKIPKKFLEHLTGFDDLFEIRIEYEGNIFRIFCCFDEGNLVVLFNAFQKKAQKTPPQELNLAKKLQKEYFKLKQEKKNHEKK